MYAYVVCLIGNKEVPGTKNSLNVLNIIRGTLNLKVIR